MPLFPTTVFIQLANPATRFVNAFDLCSSGRIWCGTHISISLHRRSIATFSIMSINTPSPFTSVLSELQSALPAQSACTASWSVEVEETGQRVLESQNVKGAIGFKHVTLAAIWADLIKDLTIQVPAASKVAIVGLTGAGKLTWLICSCFYLLIWWDHDWWGATTDYTRASTANSLVWFYKKPGSRSTKISPFSRPDAPGEEAIEAAKGQWDFFIRQLPRLRYLSFRCWRVFVLKVNANS